MRTFRGRGLLVAFVIVGVVVLLYGAAGFFLAPRLLERQLVAMAEQRLGKTLAIEKLQINPFALSIDATGLRLGEAGKQPLASARRVYLDLSLWGSGFGRGWVLSNARSDGLQVMLETQHDGNLNFAHLAQRWQQTASAPAPDAAPPRITINHLVANDGMLTYRELSEEPASTKILPIRIELEDFSTLPDREGHYSVFARFADGGVLKWRGDLTLQPLQSEGDLDLQGIKLATAWKFLRDDLRIAEPDGQLAVAGHYRFHRAGDKSSLTLTDIRADVTDVSVTREEASDPMLALKSLSVRDASFALDKRRLDMPVLTLSGGHLVVLTHPDGTLNWAGLVRPAGTTEEMAKPELNATPGRVAGEAQPWRVAVREVNVDSVALRYWDRQRPLDLQAASLDGSAALDVTVGQRVNIAARDMDLGLHKVRLGGDSPPVQLARVSLQAGSLDLSERRFGAGQILVDGGSLALERDATGRLSVAKNFTAQGNHSPASQPWRYAIEQLLVRNLDVAYSDLGFDKTLAIPVSRVSVRIDNIASNASKPMNVKASASIGSNGSATANGTVSQNFQTMDATVSLKGLALTPLQPLIARYAAVDLASGSAALNATLRYRQAGKPAFLAKGGFALADVRLNEAGSKTRVLAWKNMSTKDARLTLGPDQVRIKEIVLDAPEITIDISEKREINLVRLMKPAPAGRDEPSATVKRQNPAPKSTQFPIRVGDLRVRDGVVDYADRSLVLPFSTHVTNFAGAAAGFGTGEDRVATLQFDGDIGDFGSVDVSGRINAFSPADLTDIVASFQNVDMPTLSPYTATFLGRKVDAGKLWIAVNYRIQDGALTGNNDVTIRELKLGEKVDAPSALDLPLDLAVALLTDSEGVIHTAVPVKGDLNDPKFDVATVIREALGNLIRRIVSAPFRALAGLFNGDEDKENGSDFGNIAFQPGSAKVMASEKEKLQNVAKAMEERPQLKLIVQAPYSPGPDRAVMKRERARRELAQLLGRSLQPDEKAGPIEFENLATQRALEKLAARKTDALAVRDWVARYTEQNGVEPKRAGMFLRSSGDPKFYQAMFNWLAGIESVPDSAIESLAQSRAQNVADTLRAAGIPASRIETASPEAVERQDDKPVTAALSLEPAGTTVAADDLDAYSADADR